MVEASCHASAAKYSNNSNNNYHSFYSDTSTNSIDCEKSNHSNVVIIVKDMHIAPEVLYMLLVTRTPTCYSQFEGTVSPEICISPSNSCYKGPQKVSLL